MCYGVFYSEGKRHGERWRADGYVEMGGGIGMESGVTGRYEQSKNNQFQEQTRFMVI